MIAKANIKTLASKFSEKVLAIRRQLHQHPELSFKEYRTSEFLQQELKKQNIPFTTGHAGTGIVAIIEGANPDKKTILLRADMDALPIQEENDVSYKSVNAGVMHACGHDVHSACAIGAALILNETRSQWEGRVKLMFQPGEEVLPGGAYMMIKEGVLKDPAVDKAIALHVFPSMEAGRVGFRKGMYMASSDELYVTVNGKGGHAAMLNEYVNPLIIASEILLRINSEFMQSDTWRGTAYKGIPTVIAFGKIEGLGATNVIPAKVELAGTLRTMDESWRAEIHKRLYELIAKVSDRYGFVSELRIEKGYPVLKNDESFTQSCEKAAAEYLGNENVEELPLRMTAEDFAFVTQKVPSCFFRLGTGNKEAGITSGVHTRTFNIDESALETGSGLLAWLLLKELSA